MNICGKKEKNNNTSPTPQNTHIYKKEAKRKNGIVDNILSRKQNMQWEGTEQNVNEEVRRNVSKSDALRKEKEKR